MRNRAKCKKCNSVIESFHDADYVTCKCGEISVSGGNKLYCAAIDWNNFCRVDDQDNEIMVSVKTIESQKQPISEIQPKPSSKPTKKELVDMLKMMIDNIEKLPEYVMMTPISHYDHLSALLLLLAIFKSECDSDT